MKEKEVEPESNGKKRVKKNIKLSIGQKDLKCK